MSKKILVAEDDSFLANAYRLKLEKSGFEVMIAGDGNKAIETAKEFKPDLMVLDLIMPEKDGFSVLAEIRSDNTFSKTPILVASNLGQDEDVKKAMQLGAQGYLIKSDMSLEDVVKKINEVLEKGVSKSNSDPKPTGPDKATV